MHFELPFTKMHGLGNDYVYVNVFELEQAITDKIDWPALARNVSDRHFGIGSDGLILLMPSELDSAQARMRMFNSDGSESEMCGNGIRCVCKLAFDRRVTDTQPMKIETGNGVLTLAYETAVQGDQHVVMQVAVEMGTPVLDAKAIPVSIAESQQPQRLSLKQDLNIQEDWLNVVGAEDITCAISMGNPHLVIYVQDLSRLPLAQAGSQLEHHPLFPNRMNIHFVQVNTGDQVDVLHWERGSGATLACGTGACAVCVAGAILEKTNRQLVANLPGGPLKLEWREDNEVIMTGPATEVFTGKLMIELNGTGA